VGGGGEEKMQGDYDGPEKGMGENLCCWGGREKERMGEGIRMVRDLQR